MGVSSSDHSEISSLPPLYKNYFFDERKGENIKNEKQHNQKSATPCPQIMLLELEEKGRWRGRKVRDVPLESPLTLFEKSRIADKLILGNLVDHLQN